mgnify:CR=1 FL=1
MFEKMVYKEHESWQDKIKTFEQDFQELVNKWLKNVGKNKLYIFIDDLDRCLPENTVKLLETIKNFLYVNNALFIFAVDKRIVSQMISHQYWMLENYWEEYLMKIINYEYSLPNIDNSDVITEIFINYWFEDKSLALENISKHINLIINEPRKIKTILNNFFITLKVKQILLDNESDLILYFIAFCLIKNFGEYIDFLQEMKNYHFQHHWSPDQRNANFKNLIDNIWMKKLDSFKKYIITRIPYNNKSNFKPIDEIFDSVLEKVDKLK